MEGEGRKYLGRTVHGRRVAPEAFPPGKVEGHATVGINNHGEGDIVGESIEELGASIACGVGGDM